MEGKAILMRNVWLALPVALVFVSGCSSPSEVTTARSVPPASATSASAPSPGDPARSASDIADQWLQTRLSSDTRTDSSRADAQHRSTPWAVGAVAEPDPSPLRGGDADWQALEARKGRIRVVVTAANEDEVPDSATSAQRIRIVTETPLDEAGRAFGEAKQSVYRVTLTLTPEGWRVSGFEAS